MRLQGKYVQPVVMAGIMAFLMTAFIAGPVTPRITLAILRAAERLR